MVFVILGVVFLLTLCLSSAVSTCPPGSFYVSTKGNDTSGDGTVNNPFRMLITAVNKIRLNPNNYTICIEPGTYYNQSTYPWQGIKYVSLVPVDPNNPPLFIGLLIVISDIMLRVENLVFDSMCGFVIDSGANLILTNITSPATSFQIFSNASVVNTLSLTNLNVGSFMVSPLLQDAGLTDIIVFTSIFGEFRVTSKSVQLYNCLFSEPVYLTAATTLLYQSWFSFINSTENILNIRSYSYNDARHYIVNNTFINNTLSDKTYDSVVGLLFALSDSNTYVFFTGNFFSCNMLAISYKNSTVAPALPSGIDINNNWVIHSNIMDPSCPYECLPGYEPDMDGIAGCSKCVPGWISSGHTAPCTPCPAGTYGSYNTNNCTACANGTYSGKNSTICLICQEGTSSMDNTGCIPCPTNFYSYMGICKKCTDNDYWQQGCSGLECGFFTTVESNCKELSTNGIIVIGVVGGVVLVVIVVAIVVCACVMKKDHADYSLK